MLLSVSKWRIFRGKTETGLTNFISLSTQEQKNVHTVYVKQDCVESPVLFCVQSQWRYRWKKTMSKQWENNGRTMRGPRLKVFTCVDVCECLKYKPRTYNKRKQWERSIYLDSWYYRYCDSDDNSYIYLRCYPSFVVSIIMTVVFLCQERTRKLHQPNNNHGWLTLLLLQGSKSVKILIYTSQGLSIAFKSQTLSNLTCSTYIYRSKWVDRFWLVKALSGIVQGGQNYSKKQSKCPCVHILVNSKKRQLTGFDLYSNFWLKCSNSTRVNTRTHEWPTACIKLTTKDSKITRWKSL